MLWKTKYRGSTVESGPRSRDSFAVAALTEILTRDAGMINTQAIITYSLSKDLT